MVLLFEQVFEDLPQKGLTYAGVRDHEQIK